MKTTLALAILMLSSGAAAQEKMADQLRKAVVEEESNQNLDKAIQAYQSILAQFKEERQTAATALLHLADCYRKQGKKDQAITAYRQLLQEFPDQEKLTAAGRNYLAKTYGVSQSNSSAAKASPEEVARLRREHDAQQMYRGLLLEQIALQGKVIDSLQKRMDAGTATATEMIKARMDLLELQKALAAFDAGIMPVPQAPIKK